MATSLTELQQTGAPQVSTVGRWDSLSGNTRLLTGREQSEGVGRLLQVGPDTHLSQWLSDILGGQGLEINHQETHKRHPYLVRLRLIIRLCSFGRFQRDSGRFHIIPLSTPRSTSLRVHLKVDLLGTLRRSSGDFPSRSSTRVFALEILSSRSELCLNPSLPIAAKRQDPQMADILDQPLLSDSVGLAYINERMHPLLTVGTRSIAFLDEHVLAGKLASTLSIKGAYI